MATKENIKQLYTEDGKTKIYPVVISDSLTTDDGNTTGADAIGKWLAGAHIYVKNLTVSADPSVMNSTDRLARYNFVETKGNASGQTMTINMPLTIGVMTENGRNKNGNITINNDTTSINSYSGVSFRGNKTEMNLSDVSNGWRDSTFTKQSGLIINSKNTNNVSSLVIGNRDIFTIDANGKVGSFGNNWFSASSGDISTGNALCLQNKEGDVKIGRNLLVSGDERINGKVRIYGSDTYLDIFGGNFPIVDGASHKVSMIKMQLKEQDVMEMYYAVNNKYLVVKSSFMTMNGASLYGADSSIVIDSTGSYAKINYINLGDVSNSKINDPSNWERRITDFPYKLITGKKEYTFSTAGKTWDSSGIVSSENHIVAINENKEITSLYLNYPTNDVHGGVSVYDLSVKNAFYLGDGDVKLYKNKTNLNINTYNSTNMTFNVISSNSDDVDNSAFMVKCRLANHRDNADALKLYIDTTSASFRDTVRAEVNDVHDVYLGVPVGTVVSWYNGEKIPKHWNIWNNIEHISYLGYKDTLADRTWVYVREREYGNKYCREYNGPGRIDQYTIAIKGIGKYINVEYYFEICAQDKLHDFNKDILKLLCGECYNKYLAGDNGTISTSDRMCDADRYINDLSILKKYELDTAMANKIIKVE